MTGADIDAACREHRTRWRAHAGPIERAWGRYVMPASAVGTLAYFVVHVIGGA